MDKKVMYKLTLSLLGGGADNNIRLLNKNKDNYDIESLRS